MLSGTDTTIQGNPAHDLGIDEVMDATPHFPDATIGFLPVSTDMLYQGAHHRPQGTIEGFTIALKTSLTPIEMDAIQYLTKNVELFLIGRAVTNANRIRSAVAAEMRKITLGQVTLTANTIHDLQVFTICIGKAAQPVCKGTCLFCETKHIERIERKGRITQPRVAIIPIAHSTEILG